VAQRAFAERAHLDRRHDRTPRRSSRRYVPHQAPTRSCRSVGRCPAPRISGADPCTGFEHRREMPSDVYCLTVHADVPVQAGPRIVQIRRQVRADRRRRTSPDSGTKFAVKDRYDILSHFTFGKFWAIASTRSAPIRPGDRNAVGLGRRGQVRLRPLIAPLKREFRIRSTPIRVITVCS